MARTRRAHRSRKPQKTRRRKQKGGQATTTLTALSVSFSKFEATPELPTRLLAETQETPKVSWTSPSTQPKTILCWDSDAPAKSWVHWLVINCKGSDPSTGDEILSYEPPSPPEGTGRHRYMFGLYEQPGPITLTMSGRGNVAIEDLVASKGLTHLVSVGFRTAAAGSATV